jgi:hypothetical protein
MGGITSSVSITSLYITIELRTSLFAYTLDLGEDISASRKIEIPSTGNKKCSTPAIHPPVSVSPGARGLNLLKQFLVPFNVRSPKSLHTKHV